MVVTSGPFTAYAYGEDESSQTESAALYAETAEDDTVSENMLQSDAEAVAQISEKDLRRTEDIQQGKWTTDADTKGNWNGKYGSDGYVLCAWDNTNDVNHFPYYIDSVEYLTEDPSEYDDHILLFWNETTEAKTISADLGKNTAFGGMGLDLEKK